MLSKHRSLKMADYAGFILLTAQRRDAFTTAFPSLSRISTLGKTFSGLLWLEFKLSLVTTFEHFWCLQSSGTNVLGARFIIASKNWSFLLYRGAHVSVVPDALAKRPISDFWRFRLVLSSVTNLKINCWAYTSNLWVRWSENQYPIILQSPPERGTTTITWRTVEWHIERFFVSESQVYAMYGCNIWDTEKKGFGIRHGFVGSPRRGRWMVQVKVNDGNWWIHESMTVDEFYFKRTRNAFAITNSRQQSR
jgi:hypothetical protein